MAYFSWNSKPNNKGRIEVRTIKEIQDELIKLTKWASDSSACASVNYNTSGCNSVKWSHLAGDNNGADGNYDGNYDSGDNYNGCPGDNSDNRSPHNAGNDSYF